MKKPNNRWLIITGLILFTALSFSVQGFRIKQIAHFSADNWEKLGEHKVTLEVQHNEVVFPADGPVLSAIKIKSKKGALNLQRCVIHFANGERKSIELRNDIPAGGESRVINLVGNKSSMTKFVFWYGSSQSGAEKAEIEIWGRV
jgi:hypothetical protein